MAKNNPIQEMKPFRVPTPKVGDVVHWYPKGDRSHDPVAAIVTEVEALGRVKVTAFKPMGVPQTLRNVNFLDMPDAFRSQQARMYDQYGAWTWQTKHVPGGAYDLWHEKEAEREEREAREAADAEARAKAAAEQQKEEALA